MYMILEVEIDAGFVLLEGPKATFYPVGQPTKGECDISELPDVVIGQLLACGAIRTKKG